MAIGRSGRPHLIFVVILAVILWSVFKGGLLPSILHRTESPIDDNSFSAEIRPAGEPHPIDDMSSVEDGARAYRARRGRHPPPGFDKWYARALQSNAIIVEDFFDQIYHDLEPFWGVRPGILRNSMPGWEWTLRIRDGIVTDIPQGRARARVWGEMLRKIAKDLPDLDIAINPLDEPRVVAPWNEIRSSMKSAARRHRMMVQPVSSILDRKPVFDASSKAHQPFQKFSTTGDVWDILRKGCESESETTTPTQGPFISNWTTSKDICENPNLADIHGALIEPASLSIATSLVPIFSATKLSVNNDILLPEPAYYEESALFSTRKWWSDVNAKYPFSTKYNGLIWRGKATGGTVRQETWEAFHRHRFVSMLNGSNTALYVEENSRAWSIFKNSFDGDRDNEETLSQWLTFTADVGFTDLFCSDSRGLEDTCKEMVGQYGLADEVSMEKQFHWKYLPDVDGNSLSGRFRAFMLSNSVPIKATIFKEWHDSRLAPWIHFIPLSLPFDELWAVMAYFLGFGDRPGHDQRGKNIALYGKEWAERVLRKEDQLLYMHRVLLEYARLCDDERDRLGYIKDLVT